MRYFILIIIGILGFSELGISKETNSGLKGQSIASIESQCEVSEFLLKDLNNDKYDEFIIIGKHGQIKTFSYKPDDGDFKQIGDNWNLSFPNQTLLSLTSFDINDTDLYLICLTPEGLIAYPANQDGSFKAEGVLINRRMKFIFRIDSPVFTNFFQDINQDGHMDVIVPVLNYCEIWLNTSQSENALQGEDKIPEFSKIGKFPIQMLHTRETDLQNKQGKLSETFSIPNLTLKDINADNNLDLVVSHDTIHDYYLLKDDGIIPEKPTVSVDLSLFQDTTPKAEGIQFGEILSINNGPQLIESDLNNDKIPDYIIFHRRKMWIFHGTKEGPQFTEPSSIIKMAEDITLLLPVPLDEDEYPDLLMLKVQIPTVSKFLMGLFSDWDIKTESIGYKSINGSSFELSSTWNGEIFLRLPSILSMIRNPELLEGFDIEQKYGPAIYGDFNGDSFSDVAMLNVKSGCLEIWFGNEQDHLNFNSNKDRKNDDVSKLSKLLFSETDNVWDLNRIVTTVNSLINDQITAITGNQNPDFYISQFTDKTELKALSVDFNHDKKNELLFIYVVPQSGSYMKFEFFTITGK